MHACMHVVAIFYPLSQFCRIGISLLSLQKQPNTAPNLFQRGVEHGKYVISNIRAREPLDLRPALIVGMSFYSMGHSEKASGYHGSGRISAGMMHACTHANSRATRLPGETLLRRRRRAEYHCHCYRYVTIITIITSIINISINIGINISISNYELNDCLNATIDISMTFRSVIIRGWRAVSAAGFARISQHYGRAYGQFSHYKLSDQEYLSQNSEITALRN